MEDTSYVNLSLKKYNKLYEKAKKYDELYEKYKGKYDEVVDKVIKILANCLDSLSINEEENVITDKAVNTEFEEKTDITDNIQNYKEVSRNANKGEYVKVLTENPLCTNFHKDEIVKCVDNGEFSALDGTREEMLMPNNYYVVLENYKLKNESEEK